MFLLNHICIRIFNRREVTRRNNRERTMSTYTTSIILYTSKGIIVFIKETHDKPIGVI